MRTVFKYPLAVADIQHVEMPSGAAILCVQTQRDQPCLWALVDTDESAMVKREIRVAGTGHPISEGQMHYIGTFQLADGSLVFHTFEVL